MMADVIQQPCDRGVILCGDEPEGQIEDRAKRYVLIATIIGSGMVFINGTTVNVALPALQSSLGATVSDIQWIINGYSLLLASLILLGGSLGDHYGRKRIFMIGVAVFTLASAVCGLVNDIGPLIAARMVQGIGGALLTPGSLAIISAAFKDEERGRAIGLWSGFSALTMAIGPLLGGWLIDNLSWRWIFFMHIPLALIVLAVSYIGVPESQDDEASDHLDWLGALLVTLGLGGVTFGLISGSEQSFAQLSVWGPLLIGIILIAGFIIRERQTAEPMVPLSLFSSKTFSGAILLTLFLYPALGGALFFLPMTLIQVHGYSATAAGAALLPFILLVSFLSSWAGGLTDRFGAKLPLIVGPIITGVGFALIGLTDGQGSYWVTYFPPLILVGLGMAISVAPLTTAVMGSVDDHFAGTASGINNAVSRVASLMAVAILGILMALIFNNALNNDLDNLGISSAVEEEILDQKSNLAAITVQDTVDGETAASIRRTIETSFMDGFRAVSLVAAGLAVLSAVVSAVMIEDKRETAVPAPGD
jgi:EmrB/QacA subfamily drug resistance transporter